MSEDRPSTPSTEMEATPAPPTDERKESADALTARTNEPEPPAQEPAMKADESPSRATQPAAKAVEPSPASDEEEEERRESRKRAEFAAALEKFESHRSPDDTPTVGTKIRGRLVQIGDETCFVDFGGRSEGAVETRHLRGDDGQIAHAVGDEIDLYIIADVDQILLAPSFELRADEALQAIREAKDKDLPVSGKVSAINAGGLEVQIGGVRAFCPFSQIENGYCAEPSAYLGKSLEFLVQEIGEGGKKLVVSRRALLRREEKAQAAKLLDTLKEGTELEGTVARIQPFGAFVNIGGLEGLVHVSELQHGRVENPNEVVHQGQKVRVRVLRMEKDAKGRLRIGLSMKAAQPDPWNEIAEQFWVGKKTQGTVARLQDFGAFVELVPGIDGLVHVSEIARTPVKHPKDVLQVGQRVEVTVLNVDTERKRLSLSIKDLLPIEDTAPAGGEEKRPPREAERSPKVGDIVDGVVANIKPYGLFIDLPMYGARTRGLCPREETGEKRGADLEKKFPQGTPLKVSVIEVQPDGKIRLSLTAVQNREERAQFEDFRKTAAPATSRGGNTAMADAFKKAMEKSRS